MDIVVHETLPDSLSVIVPEIALAVGAMALLLIGVFKGNKSLNIVVWGAIALFLFVGLWMLTNVSAVVHYAFNESFVVERFAVFGKLMVLGGAAVALVMSVDYIRSEQIGKFEFPILVMLATLGMLVMISANDHLRDTQTTLGDVHGEKILKMLKQPSKKE